MIETNKSSCVNKIYDYIYKNKSITPFWEDKKSDELFIEEIKSLIQKYIELKRLADDTADRIHKLGMYYISNFYLKELISDYKLNTKSSFFFI